MAAKRHHKHDTTSTVAVTTSEPLETTTQSLPTSSIQTSSHPVTATDIDSTTTTLQSTTTTLQSTAGASDLQTASSGLDGRQGFMDREKGGSSGPREAFRGLAAAEPIRDEAATADDEEEIGGPPTQQEGGDQEEASTGSLACTGNTAALILPHALSDLPLSRVMEAIELLREAGLLVHVDERKGIPAEDVLADLDHSMEKVDCVAVGTAGYQASHSGVGNTDYNWSDSANWPVWVNALIGVAAGTLPSGFIAVKVARDLGSCRLGCGFLVARHR